jgi:molecular chaperone DnaJ
LSVVAAPPDDYYERLGVSRTAGVAELRRAYRLLALRWHPDRAGPASTELFQRISEAYQVLSDARRRALYDGQSGGHPGGHVPAATAGDEGEFVGPGGRVTWRARARHVSRIERLSGTLDELVARAVARRAGDGTIELLLRAGEAAAGGVAAISAPLPVTCPTCAGVATHHRVWCRRCEYAGHVVDDVVLLVDIPAGTVDGALFAFHTDPAGTLPPVRVRVRVS